MQTCYGIDIGGTKIELVACGHDLEVGYRRRINTPTQDYDAFLQAIAGLVRAADADLGETATAVGIGVPGVVDRGSGRQLSANVPALTGQNVGADLQRLLRRPLHLGNDLQCFALSEAHGGAAEGYASMFGVILGTGAGGGYCVDGRLVAGYNGIAGEWGHWTIPATLLARHALPILECACGLRGCLERYVSGSGLALIHRHIGGDQVEAGQIEASQVVARAQAGDTTAKQALAIHRDLLGHGLAGVILAVDPHVIVLGGGLSKFDQLYRELPAAIATHLFKGVRVPPILPPTFGDAGGARGAALLARQRSGAI
ncbi:ROK family protein [Lysobacter sp. S4-A87]|uniref:ROK family protein n=1 Tax=Lysobacter sp. S4-A87 TaxID=2925843 RepID=UPI001F53139A|nr:ROK family protein [Lysobacter sp. S4-A87]UNK47927.1 ROK family protein [Lysobacter sp. S4-A87]